MLASNAVSRHGTFAVIVVSALVAWTLACGSESSLKAKGAVDAGAVDAEIGARSSGGSPDVAGLGGGAGGAMAIDAAGTGGGGGVDGSVVDAASDATAIDAPAADTVADATQPCGDAVCRSGQTCALIGGGAVPPCDPLLDAGTCPEYRVLIPSCGGGSGPPPRQPGCTTPPDTPKCYDLPDGCDDFCTCVCGQPRGWGCNPGPGYLFCGRP